MTIPIKNQIVLLTDKESKNQVYELKCFFEKIDILTCFRHTHFDNDNHDCEPSYDYDSENERNSIEDEFITSLDEIEKSSLVIFFLTNKFLSSSRFKKQLDCAKNAKKVILTVKMENIDEKLLENVPIDINELTVFEMPEIDKSKLVEIPNEKIQDDNEIKKQRPLKKIIIKKPDDNLKHLLMFVLRALGSDHYLKYNDEHLYIEPLNYEQQPEDIYKGPIKSLIFKKKLKVCTNFQ